MTFLWKRIFKTIGREQDQLLNMFNGQFIRLTREPSFVGWILEREESRLENASTGGFRTIKETITTSIPDLSELAKGVLERGKGVEGWLHYVLKNVAYTEFGSEKTPDMRLTVNDGKGQRHVIRQAWTGEPRFWKIAPK
jgi:hypothetical protein